MSSADETGDHHRSPKASTPTHQKAKKSKTSMPDDFGISARVQAWAEDRGQGNLDEHLESFKAKCATNGYTYVDWDAALINAIRDNWAKLPASGNAQGRGKAVVANTDHVFTEAAE